ncbi:Glucosamine-phosphate N-acetyltransferase-like protein [Spiromyces aspiralis]|uniref:Glucosamine-phosphate N-acetyltransferase-like protein n=1 Tax=Spiromyces aspiralis TaxID=68401 RepID=A0ACC1HRS4_9FUNG|nr:Glucosamine-phosphate N-acetyltransferase-like protein [Spiromyces aspiralis]
MVTSISYLFDPVLLGDDARKLLPDNYVIRPLAQDDFSKGYTDLLAVLTTVGDVSEAMFNGKPHGAGLPTYYHVSHFNAANPCEHTRVSSLPATTAAITPRKDTFQSMLSSRNYYIVVVEDLAARRIVAHIEDVVVAKDQQGKKLGSIIVNQLLDLAKALGCYKTILDCSPENAPFYNKLGLVEKGLQMARYYEDGSAALSPIPTSNSNNNKL